MFLASSFTVWSVIVLVICICTLVVLAFFAGAFCYKDREDNTWQKICNNIDKSKYNFIFHGDCGISPLIHKNLYNKELCDELSSNSLFSVIYHGYPCSVYDINFTRNNKIVHGLAIIISTSFLKPEYQDVDSAFTANSSQGDYAIFPYTSGATCITIIDEEYKPIVHSSVGWHTADEFKDMLCSNMDIVYGYLDKFLNSEAIKAEE